MSGRQQPSKTNSAASATSPLVEALVSSGDRAGVGGIIANDVNGLCLVAKGNNFTDSNDTGVYTSLTRLASQLTPYQQAATNDNAAVTNLSAPLITIEMEGPASLLIKDYDGHTVAIKVPNKKE
jgi:hypothetical protein